MNKIKILIADDHPFIRSGILTMLRRVKDFEIVGEAEDGEQAIEKTGELTPHVVIIDISMPKLTGIEATKTIKKKFPETRMLVLSMHEDEEYILEVLKSGANGYILKTAGKDELVTAIRGVASGEDFYSPKISRMMISKYLSIANSEDAIDPEKTQHIPLTKREKEILKLISQGLTAKEISEKLFISPRTVDTHRTNLMRKLNLKNTAGLVRFAIENNIGRTK